MLSLYRWFPNWSRYFFPQVGLSHILLSLKLRPRGIDTARKFHSSFALGVWFMKFSLNSHIVDIFPLSPKSRYFPLISLSLMYTILVCLVINFPFNNFKIDWVDYEIFFFAILNRGVILNCFSLNLFSVFRNIFLLNTIWTNTVMVQIVFFFFSKKYCFFPICFNQMLLTSLEKIFLWKNWKWNLFMIHSSC